MAETGDDDALPARSGRGEIDRFLSELAVRPATPRQGGRRGRLIFAMDATASREPAWDRACRIQGDMFTAAATVGALEVQLVFYRGYRECKASPWVQDARSLIRKMTAVRCLGGQTQIGRVLGHALKESRRGPVDALVFVGDCLEEDVDAVCARAGELALQKVPVFIFQDGFDPVAERAFRQIARLTRGAYCRFDLGAADQLKDLLAAVAVYAAGGQAALEDVSRRKGGMARLLTSQMSGQGSGR